MDHDQALRWLRVLATDVIEHDNCRGCRCNAAQALEEMGCLREVLAGLGLPDPRTTPRQEWPRPDLPRP